MIKHGMSKTRQYAIWVGMKNRCRYPRKNYSDKGIKVCDKWQTFEGFWGDMEEGYSDELQIDRIDGNGNYEKSNCRWVTPLEQSRNRDIVNLITYKGKTQSSFDWDEEKGLPRGTVRARIKYYGWSVEDAIEKPSLSKSAKNVSYDKVRDKWKAYKTIGGKRHDIGRFNTEKEALQAVKNFKQ